MPITIDLLNKTALVTGASQSIGAESAQVCFHGSTALVRGQEVLYVTESAVFRLTPDGLELAELAPRVGEYSALPSECFVV